MLNRMIATLKDPLIKGHPLHAMLSDVPVGSLVSGSAFDLMGMLTGNRSWRVAARAAHTCAFGSGCVAAFVGLWDYQAVPREHPARWVGALHGSLNASVMALLVPNLLLRREADAPASGRPATSAVVFGAAALAVLGISGWLGGDLVYHLGWRVTPAEHAEQLEDALRQRGDTNLIETAHDTVHTYEQEHSLVP